MFTPIFIYIYIIIIIINNIMEIIIFSNRIKYLQLQQKLNNNDNNNTLNLTDKISPYLNDNEIKTKDISNNLENQNKSDSPEVKTDILSNSNTNLLNKLGSKNQSILNSQSSIKNEESNTLSPTPMSGNNLLLYSKGCGTLRSREILKA